IEPDMPPETQVMAFLVLFYTDEQQPNAEKYWPAVGRKNADWFEHAAKADDRMRSTAQDIVRGANDDRDRVARIAGLARTDVHTVARDADDAHRYEPPASDARTAYKQKEGRASDAELLFAALARAAGLDVRWMRVPSREELFFDRNMLSEGFLSMSQVAVRIDGQWLTFDPV